MNTIGLINNEIERVRMLRDNETNDFMKQYYNKMMNQLFYDKVILQEMKK